MLSARTVSRTPHSWSSGSLCRAPFATCRWSTRRRLRTVRTASNQARRRDHLFPLVPFAPNHRERFRRGGDADSQDGTVTESLPPMTPCTTTLLAGGIPPAFPPPVPCAPASRALPPLNPGPRPLAPVENPAARAAAERSASGRR
jgi:U5 snRNP spliceosome subunit